MKEDILSLLLQAESEYHSSVKHAVKEAESYVENRRGEQAAYIERLKRNLVSFEKAEGDVLEQTLLDECKKMEGEAAKLKGQMKARQEGKADHISKLLKEEVLSLLWR